MNFNYTTLHYQDSNGKMAFCDLARYSRDIFIVRERDDNPGMSVVNAIEEVVASILENFDTRFSEMKIYEFDGVNYSRPNLERRGIYFACVGWKFVPDINKELK